MLRHEHDEGVDGGQGAIQGVHGVAVVVAAEVAAVVAALARLLPELEYRLTKKSGKYLLMTLVWDVPPS